MKAIQFKSTERGEGQIGSIIMLVVVIAAAMAASQIGPIYWDNYQFEDKLTEVAGRFPPNKDGDLRAKAAIRNAVEESGLLPYLDPETCTVTSAGGTALCQRYNKNSKTQANNARLSSWSASQFDTSAICSVPVRLAPSDDSSA